MRKKFLRISEEDERHIVDFISFIARMTKLAKKELQKQNFYFEDSLLIDLVRDVSIIYLAKKKLRVI
jgi:hypothetical protein